MLVRLTPRDIERGRSLQAGAPWIVQGGSGLRLRGDDTGEQPLHLHHQPSCVTVSTDLAALLDDVKARAIALGPCEKGVSHLLHHGLVPLPGTIYEDVHFLGIGDRADLSAGDGGIGVAFSNDYPYLGQRSRQDRHPDAKVLLELITRSVSRRLERGRSGFLMLSSGKDSTALALALAEAGRADVPCVTFTAGPGDDEYVYARALCGRLGLKHETVEIPLGDDRVEEELVEFFTRSPVPCGDFSQIPYAVCVARAALDPGAVLDGAANDAYMGYVPSGRDLLKVRLALGHSPLTRALARCVPPESALSYFLRSPAAATLPGRLFRRLESRLFYPEGVETGDWWQELSDQWQHLDAIGFRNAPLERHVDQGGIALKVRLAAGFRGHQAVLPFCDPDLIDYCFNLPEAARFDRRTRTNKLLLREMLARFADYDAKAIGKRWFQFDGARFLLDHRAFALDEIRRCRLWSQRVGPLAERWFERMERKPFLHHALLTLFMLSGWHNHSRFLED